MGKAIHLGNKIRYPITITKLLKKPGETLQKLEQAFQYTFTWMKEVGDAFGETWEEKQTTYVEWESPAEGKLTEWKIRPGMVVERDMVCMEIEEGCSHSVQFAGLCALCGKNMDEVNFVTESTDADRAQINMIHDQTLLKFSDEEASRSEEQLQRRLLRDRKLSLVVDLDQTIIHACIEPTIGEWQRDPENPNYEAVKDVKAFQLNDDGSRGLASGCWYYIKQRPGLKEFLTKIAEMYELHVYTMGTRSYAREIAKIVDPDHKLFGDRIISRDENGSITQKTLSRLFPISTKMVVIIDDRADVWPKNRLNLIKVVPYDFFVGIGDINSSFLPKVQEIGKPKPKGHNLLAEAQKASQEASKDSKVGDELESSEDADESRSSPLEDLVLMSGGDNPLVLKLQAEEQAEFLEKQLKERPLLHMQQELDKSDSEEALEEVNSDSSEKSESGSDLPEHHHPRHHLLNDDDRELEYLESHLTMLHKTFYEQYDKSLASSSSSGTRVAHLRPGANRKLSLKTDSPDLSVVPDVGVVMPRLKEKVFAGCIIVLSGLVPLGVDVQRSEYGQLATSFGASLQTKISRKVTHLVVSQNRTRTQKVRQATKYPNIKIVTQSWLTESMSKWERQDEMPYEVSVPRENKIQTESGNQSENDSAADSSGEDDTSGDEENASDGDEDLEGVIPDDLVDPQSPIDAFKTFDWGEVDDELEDFMNESDSEADDNESNKADNDDIKEDISSKEDDSGSEYQESEVSGSTDSRRGSLNLPKRKRKHKEDTDADNTDEESNLVKKQRMARDRTTGLKTVKTPNSATESSLPTPDITGGEEADGDEVDQIATADDDLDDDFEAEMMAEFEKGGWEQDSGGSGAD